MSTQSTNLQKRDIEANFAIKREECLARVNCAMGDLKGIREDLEKADLNQPCEIVNSRKTAWGVHDTIEEIIFNLLELRNFWDRYKQADSTSAR